MSIASFLDHCCLLGFNVPNKVFTAQWMNSVLLFWLCMAEHREAKLPLQVQFHQVNRRRCLCPWLQSLCSSVFSIAPWLAGEAEPFWKQEHMLLGWSASYRQWWILLSGLPRMSGRGERSRKVGRTIYCNFYNFPVIKAVITPWCFHWSAVYTVGWAKALERTPGSVLTHCMILGKGFM